MTEEKDMSAKVYMAISQYGDTVHGLQHPRKELQERFTGRVSKMYRDTSDGNAVHVGYVIGSLWFELFEVKPMRRPA